MLNGIKEKIAADLKMKLDEAQKQMQEHENKNKLLT